MHADDVTGLGVAESGARTPIVLRDARGEDVDAVLAIEHAAFGDPWSRSAFTELVDEPRVSFLVADRGGVVCGYIAAWFVLDEGEIGNLAVADFARREGIGASLLDGAIRAARRAKVDSLYLEVRESNVAAHALYASRRFIEIGRRRDYYRRPREDARVLRLDIDGAAAVG